MSIIVGNLVSKGLGVFREVAFAYWFGTGDVAAAFRVAQTAYLLPTHSLIGDALSAGLLPLYRKARDTDADAARMVLAVAALYGLAFSAVVTLLLYLLSQNITAAIAPGASTGVMSLAADLLKILALSTPFYILSGMMAYVEAGHGNFSVIAWRPILLNVGSILGVYTAVALKQDQWLAVGIVLSHVAFFAWSIVSLTQSQSLRFDTRPTIVAAREAAKRLFVTTLPLMGVPLLGQASLVIERMVSSWLGTQVIPSVDYARFVSETVVQLTAVPLGIFTMATHGGANSKESRTHIAMVASGVLLVSLPVGAYIAQNAESIVSLLFARGAFDAESVALTSVILRWIAAALGATVTSYYLVKALNSQLRNRTALLVTAASALVAVGINLGCWTFIGVHTIGISIAAASTISLLLCLSVLGLWRAIAPVLASVGGGVAIQFTLLSLVDWAWPSPLNLVVSAPMTILLWVVLVRLLPPLHACAKPFLVRFPQLHLILGN